MIYRAFSLLALASCTLLALGCDSAAPEASQTVTPQSAQTGQIADPSQTKSPTVYASPFDGGGIQADPLPQPGPVVTEVVVEEENSNGGGVLGAFGRAFFGGVTEGMKEVD